MTHFPLTLPDPLLTSHPHPYSYMTIFQSLFLAVVQGITEFLPISSSGHLVLFQKLFGITTPPVFFDVLLHLGTLGAILVYFRKEIVNLIKEWRENINIWVLLIIATIPAVIIGLCINNMIEDIFSSLWLVGLMWLVMGIMLLLTKKMEKNGTKEKLGEIKNKDALIIGIFQAFALFPGISRSGSTIFGGLLKKINSKTAFAFSFLLAIPAILGATILQLISNKPNSVDLLNGLLPMLLAGIVGYYTLKFLQKTLISNKFYLFGFYCLAIGTLAVII